jgi:hypothetical protein
MPMIPAFASASGRVFIILYVSHIEVLFQGRIIFTFAVVLKKGSRRFTQICRFLIVAVILLLLIIFADGIASDASSAKIMLTTLKWRRTQFSVKISANLRETKQRRENKTATRKVKRECRKQNTDARNKHEPRELQIQKIKNRKIKTSCSKNQFSFFSSHHLGLRFIPNFLNPVPKKNY